MVLIMNAREALTLRIWNVNLAINTEGNMWEMQIKLGTRISREEIEVLENMVKKLLNKVKRIEAQLEEIKP
ncbi:MAG: hypothetical protein DRJ63_10345 [Thermoprotei archaeon]|nr:MAG: hypothetical protein DRJ63_10345 [Thermoprotei archaeon]